MKKPFKRTNFQHLYSSAAPKFLGLQLNHSCYLTFNVLMFTKKLDHLTVTAYFKGEVFTNLLSWISEPLFLYSTESLTQLDFSTEVRWQKRTSHRHAGAVFSLPFFGYCSSLLEDVLLWSSTMTLWKCFVDRINNLIVAPSFNGKHVCPYWAGATTLHNRKWATGTHIE